MSRKLKALVCIAHPDDEVLFFGGLISSHHYDWTIVCATDANADGLGVERKKRFRKSCKLLGIKHLIHLNFPDVFNQRLDVSEMTACLRALAKKENYDLIFTHGALGEYGHQHHQDVCFAVHQSFTKKIFSASYNTFPDLRVNLTKKLFDLKTKILWQVYSSETKSLLHFLPATSYESFVRLGNKEINEIYAVVTNQKKLEKKNLKVYAWMADYIEEKNYELKERPF